MKNIKLIISASNLWIFGVFLNLYNIIISHLITRNSNLSKKHIVLTFKLYEHFTDKWCKHEKKHIMLISKYFIP